MDRLIIAAFLIVSLAACEDPSNVGAGLIDEQTGTPSLLEIAAESLEIDETRDVTGGATRILVGQAEDPLLGTITATGFLDFSLQAGFTDAFEGAPVTAVSLIIRRDYTYGDPGSAVEIEIFDLTDEWTMTGRRADTTLTLGASVRTFTLPANEDSVVVDMPSDWVARQDTTLRSISFGASFHGLAFRPLSGAQVAGIALNTTLIASNTDTTSFNVARTLSSIAVSSPPAVPADRLLYQDGRSSALSMTIPVATGQTLVLNGGQLVIPVDTTLTPETGAFVRPPVRFLELHTIDSFGQELLLETATLDQDSQFVFDSRNLVGVLSLLLKGGSDLERLELRVPITEGAVDALFVKTEAASSPSARLLVTSVQ